MNLGAFKVRDGVLSTQDLQQAAVLAERLREERRQVHANGRYAGLKWYEADLDPEIDFCRKVLNELGVSEPEVFGFYYLEPGAEIHAHRDLTGASMNNRIRFHVPIVTNPNVDFRVSGERVQMKPGELWYLDTSYKHSVANYGEQSRVHIVMECAINETIQPIIPRGFKARMHSAGYIGVLGGKFVESLVKNSIKDPSYFKAQMGMIGRFIRWRFLKTGTPH